MSNELTKSYKPEHQLVIYSDGYHSYIEHYEIMENNDMSYLSEGKPLTKNSLKKMLDLVLTSDKSIFATITKLLPENVLFYDPRPGKRKLVWYSKAKEYVLHGINKTAVKAKLPAFIFMLDDGDISIYATKTGTRRPDLKTALFHAPVPNVYNDGKICMGNVKKPQNKIEIIDLIESWEKAFWGSEFTGDLRDELFDKELKAAIRSKKQFPVKQLKPHKKTLNTLLK